MKQFLLMIAVVCLCLAGCKKYPGFTPAISPIRWPRMIITDESIARCRAQFPALQRNAIFLDGPAGSQVPQMVIDAISDYLAHRNANHGGEFATSRESDPERV